MKQLYILLLAIFVSGCAKPAESREETPTGFSVERLFTVDDCTVYRFLDSGNYRYFTNCAGTTSWGESCGKGCWRDGGVSGVSR